MGLLIYWHVGCTTNTDVTVSTVVFTDTTLQSNELHTSLTVNCLVRTWLHAFTNGLAVTVRGDHPSCGDVALIPTARRSSLHSFDMPCGRGLLCVVVLALWLPREGVSLRPSRSASDCHYDIVEAAPTYAPSQSVCASNPAGAFGCALVSTAATLILTIYLIIGFSNNAMSCGDLIPHSE